MACHDEDDAVSCPFDCHVIHYRHLPTSSRCEPEQGRLRFSCQDLHLRPHPHPRPDMTIGFRGQRPCPSSLLTHHGRADRRGATRAVSSGTRWQHAEDSRPWAEVGSQEKRGERILAGPVRWHCDKGGKTTFAVKAAVQISLPADDT